MFQISISKYLVGTTTECIMDRSLPVCFITPSVASLHIHLQSSFKSVSFLTFFCQVFMSKKNCEKRWDSFCCVCSFLFSSVLLYFVLSSFALWSGLCQLFSIFLKEMKIPAQQVSQEHLVRSEAQTVQLLHQPLREQTCFPFPVWQFYCPYGLEESVILFPVFDRKFASKTVPGWLYLCFFSPILSFYPWSRFLNPAFKGPRRRRSRNPSETQARPRVKCEER